MRREGGASVPDGLLIPTSVPSPQCPMHCSFRLCPLLGPCGVTAHATSGTSSPVFMSHHLYRNVGSVVGHQTLNAMQRSRHPSKSSVQLGRDHRDMGGGEGLSKQRPRPVKGTKHLIQCNSY